MFVCPCVRACINFLKVWYTGKQTLYQCQGLRMFMKDTYAYLSYPGMLAPYVYGTCIPSSISKQFSVTLQSKHLRSLNVLRLCTWYFSDYMRTGSAFSIITITLMFMVNLFAGYTVKRPRYTIKRLTALLHLMTGETLEILLLFVMIYLAVYCFGTDARGAIPKRLQIEQIFPLSLVSFVPSYLQMQHTVILWQQIVLSVLTSFPVMSMDPF